MGMHFHLLGYPRMSPHAGVPQYMGMHPHVLWYISLWECISVYQGSPIYLGTPVYENAFPYTGVPQYVWKHLYTATPQSMGRPSTIWECLPKLGYPNLWECPYTDWSIGGVILEPIIWVKFMKTQTKTQVAPNVLISMQDSLFLDFCYVWVCCSVVGKTLKNSKPENEK